jgi:hypothetical protein
MDSEVDVMDLFWLLTLVKGEPPHGLLSLGGLC